MSAAPQKLSNPRNKIFPQNITQDILLRLPVKSLVRIKLVSTSLRSLISHPHFRQTHFHLTFKDPNLSLQKVLLSTSFHSIKLYTEKPFGNGLGGKAVDMLQLPRAIIGNERVSVVGSFNGLICLTIFGCGSFFVWNPSTGECSRISKPLALTGKAYAPGFGYDSSRDDYKILLIIKFHKNGDKYLRVAIFSLKNNYWRMLGESDKTRDFLQGYRVYSWRSSFVNGVIHWRSFNPGDGHAIVGFNLATERFHFVPNPPVDPFKLFTHVLGVLGGCLSVTCRNFGYFVELWVLKESWTEVCTLRNPGDNNGTSRVWKNDAFYVPLCKTRENEIVLLRNGNELIKADESGEVLERVYVCDDDRCEGIEFVESMLGVAFP